MSDKSKLYRAYMNEADKQIKASNESYDQTISSANRNALNRGMGRSSYALQTAANLEEDKLNAANDIKTGMQDAFIKAWLAYKQQQEQLQLQRDQFEWQKQQAAAAAAGGGGGSSSSYSKNPGTSSDTNGDGVPDWLQALNGTGSGSGGGNSIASMFGNALSSGVSNLSAKKSKTSGGNGGLLQNYNMVR